MKNSRLAIILIAMIALSQISCGSNVNIEKPKKFISTKINSDVSKVIQFKGIGKTKEELQVIENKLDDSCELIHTNEGTISFTHNNNNTDMSLITSTNYLRSIGNGDTHNNNVSFINTYDEQQLIKYLFTANKLEYHSLSINDKTSLLRYSNNIPESQYLQDILQALQNENNSNSEYFENDVLSIDILKYLRDKVDNQYKIKILTGKSSSSDTFINRICILGIASEESTNIELKVILKLNNKQRIYDIDIY